MLVGSRVRAAVTVAVAVLIAAGSLTAATLAGGPAPARAATPYRVLFDASHGETAGNADWIISTAQPDPLAQNANPTSETSWTGALSAWGVALQRSGRYSLKTLPSGGRISYGDTSNAQDLKNYNSFVLPEPNVVLTATEKTAIMNFVKNGGGLFMVSDHTGSDRNNDGWDSPKILNDLMTNNTVDSTDPFGYSIDLLNIASENPNVIGSAAGSDPIIRGPFGTVTATILRNGTTVTLKPADNAGVRGEIFRAGYSASGTTGAVVATSTFGAGRVMFWGDSSPIDDGTGQSGNTLFNGWNDPAGTNAAIALNGVEWLSGATAGGTGGCTSPGQKLGNPGFETGAAAPWTTSAGVIDNSTGEPAHAGSWKAWLNGYGAAHTDTLTQSVAIPAGCTATLSFWLHIDTAETTTTTAYDLLTVKAGATTLATYSNLNKNTGYALKSFSIATGQTLTISFSGVEGSTLQTSFVLDDTALTVS
ncbi:MAG: hydrolase [Jatrophihabitantaceae bacterium]